MRVKSVRINNFKRFGNVSAEFGLLDCLVGANNSGKTTLLQALALFDFCVHHCLNRKNGHLELTNRTIAPEDFYVLPVTNPIDLWTDRKAMQGGKQRRIKVTVGLDNGMEVTATVKLDFNRFGISIESSDTTQAALMELVELRISYLPVFSMFSPREERRLSVAIVDELARGRVNGVIRNLLLDLKQDGRLNDLVEILRRGFPNLKDMAVNFDEVTDRYINVSYSESGRPKEFDIFSAGSGFQQFLYLFGFVLRHRPSVIMLDEPDVHLHGTLQAVLLEEFKRLVGDGKQVMFATHSRELITRVGPENILSLERTDGDQASERFEGIRRLGVAFDVYDVIERLGSVDATQLPTIQAFRRVVVVEDQSDRDLLAVFCRTCLGIDVWSRIERRIAFCYSKGNPWKQHDIKRLRMLLQQLMTLEGSPLKLFVVADRDYHPDLEWLRASLAVENVTWHIWERAEIENYLLNRPAMERLVASRDGNRTLESVSFQAEIEDLVNDSKTNASDRLVQAFDELRVRRKEPWNAATMARMAREFLDEHWEGEKLALADAKDVVLPGIKRWLQENGFGQFSDRKLAETLTKDELPHEIHDVAMELAEFAGVQLT
jgi:AAA domain, putative AbiEii toxin, Type IV TA system